KSKMSGNIFVEGFTSVLRMRFNKPTTPAVVKQQSSEPEAIRIVEEEPSVAQK
ncbi:MAG: hypothetical protein JO011_04365, partial [Ktedonobacteraceae bacterium]|nr:hypothetical protein [Ktedonobacteraceae bacterium]